MRDRRDKTQLFKDRLRAALRRIRRHVPPGLRFVLGLLLIVGGVFGFLPVLGFWMIPLGLMLCAFDVRLLLRWWRTRRRR